MASRDGEVAKIIELAAPVRTTQLAAQNKRKEKARIAARARRSQEASIIMEMANELHITQEKIRRIDKATIVKLAIDYIKAFEVLCSNTYDLQFQRPRHLNTQTQPQAHHHKQHQTEAEAEDEEAEEQQQLQLDLTTIKQEHQQCQYSTPKLNTHSIFAPKTQDMETHFLVLDDDDDLTHLAPQAGDVLIPLEVEPLGMLVM